MNYLLIAAGLGVLMLVLVDIFKTVVHVHGGGWISHYLARSVWRAVYFLSGKNARSPLLNYAGGLVLMVLIVNWNVLLWTGYSLIFISTPGSVVDAITGEQTGIIGKIYYVGYVLTTLGNGDMQSGSDAWRLVTNVMAMNSLVFLSLGISYVVPVLEAVIDKRTLAAHIQKLGSTPQEIIQNGYTGKGFEPLYGRFATLESMLIKHGERHLAYPILHYFHSNIRWHSLHISIAVLSEACDIQEAYGLDTSEQAYAWKILRKSIVHLEAQHAGGFGPVGSDPPPFDYFEGLPASLQEGRDPHPALTEERDGQRARLRDYIINDGWEWEDVVRVR